MASLSFSDKPKNAKGTLLRILSYLTSFRYLVFLVIILSLLSNILSLLGPGLAGNAISEASKGPGMVDFDMVLYYVKRMLIFYSVSSFLTITINILMQYVSKWAMQKMRKDVFAKLMRLPVNFFDRNSAGDTISRVSYDIDVVGTCLANEVTLIVTSLVTIIGSLVMMLVLSPILSIVVIVTIPLSIFYTGRMRQRTRPLFSRRSKNYGAMNGLVEELFSGQRTIQAYVYEKEASRRFNEANSNAADGYFRAEYLSSTIGPTMGCINNISLALISIFGAIFYMADWVSLGPISSFVLYSRKFTGPVNELANVLNEIFSALSAAERVFYLLDQSEESEDRPSAETLENVSGHVTMDHVSFGYEPEKIVLHDLSLDAQPGKLTAIVGPTGAGKSTIINLLMRFYDANSGCIRIDDRDIMNCTRNSLRSTYAMVLQDTWLFEGTIYENIAYGKENATMEEVVQAAKAARVHNFILRLPDGYNTVIREDGSNISKGQKQLLTIARAMLYNANMLILDEATSNVDTGTEREVQKAMQDLMTDRTSFVIAHRLSTIRNASNILVIDHGDVVEQGTHESLMVQRGFYYRLYAAQFE